jgi:hypothetical protein
MMCEIQEPSYCFSIVVYNSSQWIFFQQLGCRSKGVTPHLVLDVNVDEVCNKNATVDSNTIEVLCCEEDFCNKKHEQPTSGAVVEGLVLGIKCNYYLHNVDVQHEEVMMCEIQEPSYCFSIVVYNSSQWIFFQQLGCRSKGVTPHLVLDVNVDEVCNKNATVDSNTIEVLCCEEDFCNKKHEQPTSGAVVEERACPSEAICVATVATAVTGLALAVAFVLGMVMYYVCWRQQYKKLKSQSTTLSTLRRNGIDAKADLESSA